MSSITLDGYSSISNHALDALQDDALLPICTACGTQYPKSVDSCPICQDPRQFVNPAGQSWTNLAELGQSRKHKILRDEEDGRISFIQTEPGFGISQTPTLIETGDGMYIWDCAAFLSPHLIAYLSERPQPLKAIAISHPHFFSTSLTWARALRVPLYLCEDDQVWYQRFEDIKESDDIRWFKDTVELGPRVSVVQCGGHFPGSCILYWDRLGEPAPPKDNLPSKPTPVSGIIFCADTIMVQPTQTDFTFVWSAPNMIPLRPINVLAVRRRIEHLSFSQATSSWPNRFIRQDAKEILKRSVLTHLNACGWKMDDRSGYLIPR